MRRDMDYVKSMTVSIFDDDTACATVVYRVFRRKLMRLRFVNVPLRPSDTLPIRLRGIIAALDMVGPGVAHAGLGMRNVRHVDPVQTGPVCKYYIVADQDLMNSVAAELEENVDG